MGGGGILLVVKCMVPVWGFLFTLRSGLSISPIFFSIPPFPFPFPHGGSEWIFWSFSGGGLLSSEQKLKQ